MECFIFFASRFPQSSLSNTAMPCSLVGSKRQRVAPYKDLHPKGLKLTKMHPDSGQQEAGTCQAAQAPWGMELQRSPSLITAPINLLIVPASGNGNGKLVKLTVNYHWLHAGP